MQKYSFPKEKIKIYLLEGVHQAAVSFFERQGYAVEQINRAMSADELLEIAGDAHLLGIRSRTQLTPELFQAARRLLAVGCFCIGTNQVALESAAQAGVPVFNAPFSNTRSVAELAMASIVMLARKADYRSMKMHQGVWEKSALECYEVRQKTLGIVGYGHIGPQLGLLAEAFGLKVVFFDIAPKLPLGNAIALGSLEELLERSDFVSLHVPGTPETKNMIGESQLGCMKKGSYLLNMSRGDVVQISALAEALKSGKLLGAAVDVFPSEPKSNSEEFKSELRGLDNVILTPHIGGATVEAQRNIGVEVAEKLVKFLDLGSSTGAVNFPEIDLPMVRDGHRVLNIHKNVPGVLGKINSIIADMGVNIHSQYLGTKSDVGYLIMDVDKHISGEVKARIDELDFNIRTRLLF